MRLVLRLWPILGALVLVSCGVVDDHETINEVRDRWEAEIDDFYLPMTELGEAEFTSAWSAERDRWLAAISAAKATPDGNENEQVFAEADVRYTWGLGVLVYPIYHARFLRDETFTVSETFFDQLDQLPLDQPDLLAVEPYTDFLDRYGRKLWQERVDAPRFSRTGIRFTAARLEIASEFESPEVRCHLTALALDQHFEDFEADGLTTEVTDYAATCPGERADGILARFSEAIAEREGHAIEVYHSVDGFDLEAHIYQPEEQDETKPMVVWIHGGGWLTGSWSWCGPCHFFKDEGYVVAQIEYRLRGRHDTYVGDSLNDTIEAVRFARENAEAYGADPERIILSGFSAGGHLSLSAATLTSVPKEDRPDAVVALSGCVTFENDGYATSMSGGREEALRLSPLLHIGDGHPPTLLVNAKTDDLCPFDQASSYVEAMVASGNDSVFVPIEEGGHFFLREAANVQPTKDQIMTFLSARGF